MHFCGEHMRGGSDRAPSAPPAAEGGTRLAVRPILSNLRPRKLWRNIRRKKQD